MKKLIEQAERLRQKGEGAQVMRSTASLKRKLAEMVAARAGEAHDDALASVEDMLAEWPGNPHLHIAWASLVQLQDEPRRSLEEVKKALQVAVDLDRRSPAASIELGHFLDNVKDDPAAAANAFAEGIASARRLLIDGLLGQAKAFLQLDRRDDAIRCLTESLRLAEAGDDAKVDGPIAERIEDLMKDVVLARSA